MNLKKRDKIKTDLHLLATGTNMLGTAKGSCQIAGTVPHEAVGQALGRHPQLAHCIVGHSECTVNECRRMYS